MASTNRWILVDDSNGVSPTGFVGPIDSARILRSVSEHAARGSQGAMACNLQLAYNPIAAQATVTFTGAGSNLDTLTIGTITVTFVTGTPSGSQVKIGGSASATAANLNTFINANGYNNNLQGVCYSTVNGAVVTLICAIPGVIGNMLALTKSSTAITLTNLWGASVAGTEGTFGTFAQGK